MQKVVIIGTDSYIATGLEYYLKDCKVDKLCFDNWHDNLELLQEADYVINFSIAPDFSTRKIEPADVLDVQIANYLKNCKTRYIFISSRKVYGISDALTIHKETDALCGCDLYSHNKIMTEQALKDILKDRLTVLRISNVIGEPVKRKGYKTFVGWISENFLKYGKLTLTQNADAVKDFITKDFLHENIAALIYRHKTGIYNVSAGFGTTVRDILSGYVGVQNIDFQAQDLPIMDQFVLDNTKLIQATNCEFTSEKLAKYLSVCHSKVLQYKDLT